MEANSETLRQRTVPSALPSHLQSCPRRLHSNSSPSFDLMMASASASARKGLRAAPLLPLLLLLGCLLLGAMAVTARAANADTNSRKLLQAAGELPRLRCRDCRKVG